MRKLLSTATVVATVLFLPALASAQDATKLPAADMDFVNQATAAGMAEVDLGKLGAEKATDQSVKQFAQRMVDDHSKANDQLIKILADKKDRKSKFRRNCRRTPHRRRACPSPTSIANA